MHGHMFQCKNQQPNAMQGQGLEARLSLKGLTLTRIRSDILGFQACNPRTWKETSRAPNRDGVLPSQSKAINGVAGNCGDTRMEQSFWRVFESPARTGETLSFSDWRRQEACRIFASVSIVMIKSV